MRLCRRLGLLRGGIRAAGGGDGGGWMDMLWRNTEGAGWIPICGWGGLGGTTYRIGEGWGIESESTRLC